jgi:hypothetical protein
MFSDRITDGRPEKRKADDPVLGSQLRLDTSKHIQHGSALHCAGRVCRWHVAVIADRYGLGRRVGSDWSLTPDSSASIAPALQ